MCTPDILMESARVIIITQYGTMQSTSMHTWNLGTYCQNNNYSGIDLESITINSSQKGFSNTQNTNKSFNSYVSIQCSSASRKRFPKQSLFYYNTNTPKNQVPIKKAQL